MERPEKPLLDQMVGEAFSNNASAETDQPLKNRRPLKYIIEFDPDVQTERSPDDALAAMVLEAAGGFARDADDATNLGLIFINESQRRASARPKKPIPTLCTGQTITDIFEYLGE